MGDDQHGAGELAQMLLQPGDRLGVEVVGRLVEQQEVVVFQKQLGQRHAALFAARQRRHVGIARRAAQRVHRHLDLAVEVPEVLGVDDVLDLGGLLGVLVRVVHHQRIVFVDQRLVLGDAQHDVAEHVEAGVELRLLRQVADGGALGEPGLAGEFLVEPGHDSQKRRLARAVGAEHADLGVRVELQVDVIENFLATTRAPWRVDLPVSGFAFGRCSRASAAGRESKNADTGVLAGAM
ncbi:MAG: ribosomal protein [Proteobacteria bacterium]|nr:ribosomal protein [Pseudomonadota bacterium]